MRKQYDFTKARLNPYAKRLKRSVTIRLDEATVAYFKALAEQSEIPYQTLINLYLRDCAAQQKKVSVRWLPPARGAA
ncbi:MAG TPA: BrnA antitoxin family protein [Steroidobacteraceae bacterium]|nr:BrnA antitoxin family protein [Steroidobacteraceae bacterium]